MSVLCFGACMCFPPTLSSHILSFHSISLAKGAQSVPKYKMFSKGKRYPVECSLSVRVLVYVVVRVMWVFCLLCALCTMFQECTLPLEQRSLIRVLLAQYGRVRGCAVYSLQ